MIILWTFLYWGCEEWECVAMLFYTCSQSYLKMEEIDTSSVSTDSASNVKHNPEKEAAATDWGREVGTRCEQLSSTTGAPFCRQCGQSSRILAVSWGPWLPGMFSGWSQRSLITSVCSLGWRQVDVPKPSRESGKTWKTATFTGRLNPSKASVPPHGTQGISCCHSNPSSRSSPAIPFVLP